MKNRRFGLCLVVLVLAALVQPTISAPNNYDEGLQPPPRPEPRRPSGGSEIVNSRPPTEQPLPSDGGERQPTTATPPLPQPAPTPSLSQLLLSSLSLPSEWMVQVSVGFVLLFVAGLELLRSSRDGEQVLQQRLEAALRHEDFLTSAALLEMGVPSSKETDKVRGSLLKHIPLNHFSNPSVGELQGHLKSTNLQSLACVGLALEFHQTVVKQPGLPTLTTSNTPLRLTGPGPSNGPVALLTQTDPNPTTALIQTTSSAAQSASATAPESVPLVRPGPSSSSSATTSSSSSSSSSPSSSSSSTATASPASSSSTAIVEDLSDNDDDSDSKPKRERRVTPRRMNGVHARSVEYPEDRQAMVRSSEGELLMAWQMARIGQTMEADLEMKLDTKRQQDALYLLEVVRAKNAVEERQRELEREIELMKDAQLRRLVLLSAVIHGIGPFVRMVLSSRDSSSQVCLIPELSIPAFLPLLESFSTSSCLCFSVPNRSFVALFLWLTFFCMRLFSFGSPYQPLIFSAALALLGIHSIAIALILLGFFALVLYLIRLSAPHILFNRPWLTVGAVLILSLTSSILLHPYIARLTGTL